MLTAAVSITASGGTTDYSYNWNDDVTVEDRTDLSAGTYDVTVTDANGCKAYGSWTVAEPTAIALQTSKVDPTCFGHVDGSVSVSASGGTPGYTYEWSNGITTADNDGLAGGTYDVTVTDANGCEASASVTITTPTDITVTLADMDNVDCNGNSTGSIDIDVQGGSGTYTYVWSNGATTQDLTDIPAGIYQVTVYDENWCSAVFTKEITEPTALEVNSVQVTNVTCNGDADGEIDIEIIGGTGAYSYLWSDDVTLEDRTGLSGGDYDVTVTDAKGCKVSGSWTVTEATAIALQTSKVDPTCFGHVDGSVSVSASGGTPGYTYLWSNGTATADNDGLAGGTYDVTVTDANGCAASASVTITTPTDITVTMVDMDNVDCNGNSTGSIDIDVQGGSGTYTYVWSNGATTQDLTDIPAGIYQVTVYDENWCSAVFTKEITEPTALEVNSVQVTNVTCNGDADGEIDIEIIGGTGEYSYLWSDDVTVEDRTGLSGGDHDVTVTDANGCEVSASITIVEPEALTATTTFQNASCNGATDGTATVHPDRRHSTVLIPVGCECR